MKQLIFQWNRLKALFRAVSDEFFGPSGFWKNPLKILILIKNRLFVSPRALKVLLSVKTWLVLGLGASNLFVMGFTLNIYLQSSGISLYSSSYSSLVRTNCKTEIRTVLRGGENTTQYCSVEAKNQRHKGAKYTQKMKFKIAKVKKTNGKAKLVITEEHVKIDDATKHAEKLDTTVCADGSCGEEDIEGDFCLEGCNRADDSDVRQVINRLVHLMEKKEEAIEGDLDEVKEEYERERIEKREALVRQRRCEGYWDTDDESYVEYDTEGRLDCKTAKTLRMNPYEKDRYWESVLKEEFWKIALDEDEDPHVMMGHLDRIRRSSQFSYNSRNSAGLIQDYVSWRDVYDDLEDDFRKNLFVDSIVKSASDLSYHLGSQGRQDMLKLRSGMDKHFDLSGARLNPIIDRMPDPSAVYTPASAASSAPSAPAAGTPYSQTLDLY